ncbi:MAG: hypothetical protein LUG52_02005 [Clostridia bacterium]|nr:hypothetical protein [Clostridia bacterium]
MKKLEKVLAIIVCAVMVMGVMPLLSVNADSSDTTSIDNWTALGNAYYDYDENYYVLTEKQTWQTGAIWYDKVSYADMDVSFDYYTGNDSNGADGIAFIFYGDCNYTLVAGQDMSFSGCKGYGVELDTYRNSDYNDPSYNHIALVKNSTKNHLATAKLTESEDGNWHNLRVVVSDGVMYAYVDDVLKITYEVSETGYGGIGISAATGDGTSEHYVKNISVSVGSGGGMGGRITVIGSSAEQVLDESTLEDLALLENITVKNDTIYGPSITFLGKTFYLFQLDGTLTLNLGDYTFQFKVDTEDKTIKGLVGANADLGVGDKSTSASTGTDYTGQGEWNKAYQSVRTMYKALTGGTLDNSKGSVSRKNFDALYDSLKAESSNLFLNIKGQYIGYLEFSYETSNIIFAEGGMMIKASASGSLDSRIAAFPAAYLTVGLSVDISGSVTVAFEDCTKPLSFGTELNAKPALNVGIGLGSKKAKLYIEGGLKGTLGIKAAISTGSFLQEDYEPLKIDVTGAVYLKGKLFVLSSEVSWELVSVQLYPKEDEAETASLMSLEAFNDTSQFKLMGREYLDGQQMTLFALRDNEVFEKVSLYPYSEPILTALDDGRRVLIWVDDNGEKADADRTSLFYSIEENGVWSSAATIHDNEGYNGSPVVYSDGEKIYVVWQRAEEALGDEATVEEMASAVNLYLSIFDGSEFSEPVCVSNSENAESAYDVSLADDGTVIVTWTENSENDMFMSEGVNTVYRRTYADGVFGETESVFETEDFVEETAIHGDDVIISLYNESNGGRIYVNGAEMAATGDETHMQLAGDVLYYLVDGALYAYNFASGETSACGIDGISNFTIAENGENKALFTLVSTGFTCELYENFYDAESGEWGEWTPLTDYEKYIRDYSPILNDDGSVSMAFNLVDVDETAEDIYSTVTLKVADECSYSDMVVDDVLYYTDYIEEGAAIDLFFDVRNDGRETIENVTATLSDENGEITTEVIKAGIAAGEEKTLSIAYTVPWNFTGADLRVDVESDTDDKNSANNYATCTIGYADLEITELEIVTYPGGAKITGHLDNIGFADVDDAQITVYNSNASGDVLATMDAGSVAAGETVEFEYELPESYLSLDNDEILYGIFFDAECDEVEERLDNNDEKIVFGDLSEEVRELGITLLSGAQVRVGSGVTAENKVGDGSGIRFIAQLDKTNTLVADIFDEKDENGDALFGVAIWADEYDEETEPTYIPANKFQDTDETIFTAALVNINAANYNRVYVARPYALIDGSYVYGDAVARTPYQVAAGNLLSGSDMSNALVSVLNAYANETGARITLTYSSSESSFAIGEAAYVSGGDDNASQAFFTASCKEITDEEGNVKGTTITLTGANSDVTFYSYWSEYLRINNNNSEAVKHIDVNNAVIEKDEESGITALTFDFYINVNDVPQSAEE